MAISWTFARRLGCGHQRWPCSGYHRPSYTYMRVGATHRWPTSMISGAWRAHFTRPRRHLGNFRALWTGWAWCKPNPRPSQTMVWLGIQFNTLDMSMAIPKAKLGEVMECVTAWGGKKRATRKEMQSLLSLLNFVASVPPPPTRLFTNRMLDDLREAPQFCAATLSCQFKQDISFFMELLPMFNSRCIMGKALVPYQHQVELEACLTGCGAVVGDQFYAVAFPQEVLSREHTIAHLELLNVAIAVKVWRERWSGWTVQVYCDSMKSVFVLQTGKSREHFMRECAREIFLYTAVCDIDIQVCHRPGLEIIWTYPLLHEHTNEKFQAFMREDSHLRTATRIEVPSKFFEIRNRL